MEKRKLILGLLGGAALLSASISINTLFVDNAYADAAKGEDIFFNSEDAECNSCHKLQGKGGSKVKKIPNLSNVGSMLTRDQIYLKISNPCAVQADGFRSDWEEEVMPREFIDLIGKEAIGHLADFLSTQKDTSVATPKGILISDDEMEEWC